MKSQSAIGTRRAWAMAVAIWIIGTGCELKSAEPEVESSYEARELAATAARAKDPAWKPAQQETGIIRVGDDKRGGELSNFCVGKDGNILACWSMEDEENKRAAGANEIRVHSPDGKFLKTIPLSTAPGAICVDHEGNILVGGGGKLFKLDSQGKVLVTADAPAMKLPATLDKDSENKLKEAGITSKEDLDDYKKQIAARRGVITGMAVTPQDVFVASPSPNGLGYCVYRMDHQLANPLLIVDKLRGCCGQMDIQAHDEKLWIPHNARHRVECRDRDGKEISKFGKEGRTKADQFGGCCEPKNLRFTSSGEILTAESGPPTCIKKFSQDGKFLGVIALLGGNGDCVRVTVDVSPDGKQFYFLDTEKNAIRVFGTKGS